MGQISGGLFWVPLPLRADDILRPEVIGRSRLDLDDAAGCRHSSLAGFHVSPVDVDGAGRAVSLLAAVLHLAVRACSKKENA